MMTAQSIPSAANALPPLQPQNQDLLWSAKSNATVATLSCSNGIKRFRAVKIFPDHWHDKKGT